MTKYKATLFTENFSGVYSPAPKVGIIKMIIGAAIVGIVIGTVLCALFISIFLNY